MQHPNVSYINNCLFYPKLIAHGMHGLRGIPVMLPAVVGPKVDLGYRMHQQKTVGLTACQLMLLKPKTATLMDAQVSLNTCIIS